MHARILLGAFALVGAANAPAATVTVTTLSDAAGACPGANCTLRAAIAAANASDTIVFDPAIVPGTIALAGSELVIGKSLTLSGPGADRFTVLAASLQRVLRVTAGNVTISGLALAGGEVRPPAQAAAPPGINGQNGVIAEGGCIRTAAGSSLVLDRVAVRDCLADGGDGGDGGDGAAGASGGAGGRGGDGGAARGGAIAAFGDLTLLQSSVADSLARGGRGGSGGDGGNSAFNNGGSGGDAGHAGAAQGGALYLGGSNVLLMRNSTLATATLTADSGGSGGAGGGGGVGGGQGSGGRGGNAGPLSGGDVYLGAAMPMADIEFSTLAPAAMMAGLAGPGGPSNGPSGTNAIVQGEIVFTLATPRVRASVLAGSSSANDCQGTVMASGNNLDADASCATSAHATFATTFGSAVPVIDGGRESFLPLAAGPAVNAASDCIDLFGAAVTQDQSGRARPVGAQCDLGAIEFDLRLFRDGFE